MRATLLHARAEVQLRRAKIGTCVLPVHKPLRGRSAARAFEHEVLRCIPLNGLTIKNESVLVLLEGQVTSEREQRQSGEDNGQK